MLLKTIIIIAAALTLLYYTYYASTGLYFDVPYLDFI